ncbi:MAG: SCO family protein, partial [Oleiphilaceae bacterium]|nr:SCO family protein [Oleiphilaceae bacterium]
MRVHVTWIALGAFVLAAILSIILFGGRDDEPEDVRAAYLPGGDFALTHGDTTFDMRSLRGSPYVLYFGFTHCPDVCPTGLAKIRDAFQQLPQQSVAKALFVTLDPARDNAEHVQRYAEFFHPDIIGRTGTLEEISALAKAYGTYFKANEPDDQGNYSVDHTAYFYLIDKQGKLKRVLDH